MFTSGLKVLFKICFNYGVNLMGQISALTVETYDSLEEKAISKLSNLVVQAFQPMVFQRYGYPFHIRSESELWKYIDVMHELRFEGDFVYFLEGITAYEFDLLKRLTEQICRFGESRFQKKAIARGTVLRSLNVLRHIRYLFGSARPRVFEMGPGCGYLGALLMLEGYPYAATDVSQAFYLYQNHFWNFISNGNITDLVGKGDVQEVCSGIQPGSAIHLPWWEFVALHPESVPQFDVITCNAALGEMHHDSLGFSLKIARAFLNDSADETPKVFVFEGWGHPQNSHAKVTERFYKSGFVLAHNDPWITVFAPLGTKGAAGSLDLPRPITKPCFWRLENGLRRLAGAPPKNPNAVSYEPSSYASSNNCLSQLILSGRQSDKDAKTVKIDQINRFYTDLLGSEDHDTPDERFLKLNGWSAMRHGGGLDKRVLVDTHLDTGEK
jgi:hypothetical protein